MVSPLIQLKRTLQDALSFKDSQINRYYILSGIQLLPNNDTRYVQVTDIPDGLHLEDWTVYAVNFSTGEKTDITDSFNVDAYTNSTNGNPQLYWSLQNVAFDFGYDFIYLEINQALGETFYSTPFLLTDINKDRTIQIHYKEKKSEVMQSVGIQCWFRQIQRNEERTQYYQVSKKTSTTSRQKLTKLEKYFSELMPLSILDLILDAIGCPYVYFDGIRGSLFEAVKLPDLISEENFGKIEFLMSMKDWDIYVEPNPETAPSSGDWYGSDWSPTDWLIYTT